MNNVLILLLSIITISLNDPLEKLQGKWKLESYDAFSSVINSEYFQKATEDQKTMIIKEINFSLANTYMEFKGDSVVIDNAGNGNVTKVIRRYIVYNDRLTFLKIDKLESHEYRLIEVSDSKLILDFNYDKDLKRIFLEFRKVNE